MIIEYGKVKGLQGFIFIVSDKAKIKAIYPFLCDKMDVEFCSQYVISKWGKPESIKKVDLSCLKKIKFDQLELSTLTPFAKKVYQKLYSTKAGELLSYGELAAKAGNPKAARAVGTLMSRNLHPVVVPCHRVYAKSGAVNFSIVCFNKRPKTCAKKGQLDLHDCASRIKSSLRKNENE